MTASLDEQHGVIAVVDTIRALALGCPGVAAMSGAARSYLPGRTVAGVTVDEHRVDVHLIARYGAPLPGITERLEVLLLPVTAGRSLHVHFQGIVLPGETAPAEDDQPSAAPPTGAGADG
jgi:hypothetical protein